jgi:hypothetical protein
MLPTDVGVRVPYLEDDPFFLTTPKRIDDDVEAFAHQLGGLTVSFVPVRPATDSETGFCHRNVAEHVELHGGRAAVGYALWSNRLLLMGEYHAVWATPTGELIDPTPAAEGEQWICFAWDQCHPAHYDFYDRRPNRAMSIVGKADPKAVAKAIDGLSPARLVYERRRADRAGLDLETYLAGKVGRSALSVAVDELIAASEKRDRLVVLTATRVLSHDPKAFLAAQSKVSEVESRIRRLLAKEDGTKSDVPTSERASADVTASRPFADDRASDAGPPKPKRDTRCAPTARSVSTIIDDATDSSLGAAKDSSGFGDLIEALLNPNFDVVAIDLAESGPKVLFGASSRPKCGAQSHVAADPRAEEPSEEIARLIKNRLGDIKDEPVGATSASKPRS